MADSQLFRSDIAFDKVTFVILIHLCDLLPVDFVVLFPSPDVCYQFENYTHTHDPRNRHQGGQRGVGRNRGDRLQESIENVESVDYVLQLLEDSHRQEGENSILCGFNLILGEPRSSR